MGPCTWARATVVWRRQVAIALHGNLTGWPALGRRTPHQPASRRLGPDTSFPTAGSRRGARGQNSRTAASACGRASKDSRFTQISDSQNDSPGNSNQTAAGASRRAQQRGPHRPRFRFPMLRPRPKPQDPRRRVPSSQQRGPHHRRFRFPMFRPRPKPQDPRRHLPSSHQRGPLLARLGLPKKRSRPRQKAPNQQDPRPHPPWK